MEIFCYLFKSSRQNLQASFLAKHLINLMKDIGKSQPSCVNRLANSEMNFSTLQQILKLVAVKSIAIVDCMKRFKHINLGQKL